MSKKSDTLFIRQATLADLSDMWGIEQRAYPISWSEKVLADCLERGYPSWVLQKDFKTIGYAITTIAMDEVHLLNLAIDPDFQQRGYGRRLLNYLLADSRARSMTRVILEVRFSNPEAKKLYLSAGFEEIGIRKNYYPSPDGREHAYVMAISCESS